MNLLFNSAYLPSIFAGLCAASAALVIIDFFAYTSARYHERFLKEAEVELDDVLLNLPSNKIFDMTLALSGLSGFVTILLFASMSDNFTWSKGVILGIIVAIAAFPLPRLYLRHLKRQRLKKFNEQLEDALNGMSSSLKAGFSINQAMEAIANENKPPISFEFRLLMQEIRLGVPLEKALDNMCARLDSDDFELVTTAIITARQTGGELTMVFERLASVIRERGRITNKLNAMTSQGRLQTGIIAIMPLVLVFAMSKVAPTTMDLFFGSWIGIFVMMAAAVLIGIGIMVIRKIINIDI